MSAKKLLRADAHRTPLKTESLHSETRAIKGVDI
jgi:hypothetical protein